MLQEAGIPVPKHIIVSREGVPAGQDPEGFEETEDFVAMNGALKFLRLQTPIFIIYNS